MRTTASALSLLLFAGFAAGQDAHVDPTVVLRSCPACHEGHGMSGSPMLPSAQAPLCLSCHDSQAQANGKIASGELASSAQPPLLGNALAQTFTHPLSQSIFSRHDGGVTCSTCHTPHRHSTDQVAALGAQKLSTRNPGRLEYELCLSCHGAGGGAVQASIDIAQKVQGGNPSFHPIVAPALERSPTVLPALSGQHINCTDCHGNADPSGAAGIHGSSVEHLLLDDFTSVDGVSESASVYALCYRCHNRNDLFDDKVSSFPEHDKHVRGENASCATCHDPHGSTANRALIRFGSGEFVPGVSPSGKNGRLEFISTSPGSGSCSLTCHGEDHDPFSYGGQGIISTFDSLDALMPSVVAPPSAPNRLPARPSAPRRDRERIPPRER